MLLGLLLTIQIILCLALIGAVLLQRSEGGALGMGGGPSGFMTARGAGNLLTRVTAVLATLFFLNSMGLTIAGNAARGGSSVIDRVGVESIDPNALKTRPGAAPAPQPAAPVPAAPAPSLDDLAAPLPQTGGAAAPASPPPAAPAQ